MVHDTRMNLGTVIVDYDAGNLRSVQRACAQVGVSATITPEPAAVAGAERVIFPGVGAADSAMATLRARGLDTALRQAYASGTPILGICLGLQISLGHSQEGDTETLGLVPGRVRRFRLDDPRLKIPHMGWNEVRCLRRHAVLDGLHEADECYFVHSFYPEPDESSDVLAVSDYEHAFCCALGRANFIGTQFHPEKSGRVGLNLLARFARWDGRPAGTGRERG